MSIGVPEAARRQGVSPQRVRAQIKHGRIWASRQGRDWLIDPASLPKEQRRSRPMSPRMAWAFIEMASGVLPEELDPAEASRLRKRIERLRDSDQQASALRDWLPARAARMCFISKDLDLLRSDARLLLAGLSLPEAGLNSAGAVEAYVRADEVAGIVARHMLREVPASRADVVLHVVPALNFDPHMPMLIAADLADYADQYFREDARVSELLGGLL